MFLDEENVDGTMPAASDDTAEETTDAPAADADAEEVEAPAGTEEVA